MKDKEGKCFKEGVVNDTDYYWETYLKNRNVNVGFNNNKATFLWQLSYWGALET